MTNPLLLLLRKIGEELYQALPAMAANIGLKAFDEYRVDIANLTGSRLQNAKVHFAGCEGFDSLVTHPDIYARASITSSATLDKYGVGRKQLKTKWLRNTQAVAVVPNS